MVDSKLDIGAGSDGNVDKGPDQCSIRRDRDQTSLCGSILPHKPREFQTRVHWRIFGGSIHLTEIGDDAVNESRLGKVNRPIVVISFDLDPGTELRFTKIANLVPVTELLDELVTGRVG